MYMYVWRRGKCTEKQSTPKQFSLSTYQLVATKRILWHSLVVKWQLPDNLNKVPPGKELVVTAGQESQLSSRLVQAWRLLLWRSCC